MISFLPRSSLRASLLASLLAGVPALAAAQVVSPGTTEPGLLKSATEKSELAFHGEVTHIDYALSEPTGAEGNRVPFTFVTYEVKEVLRGSFEGKSLTLRFLGGLDRRTMNILTSCTMPQIDVGDEDVLFVAGNGTSMMPLVQGLSGRLRVVDGQVYTEQGRSLTIGADGDLEIGPQYLLPQILSATIEGKLFERPVPGTALALPSSATRVEDLVRNVRERARRLPPVKARFVSADKDQPNQGPVVEAVAPPAKKPGESGGPDPVQPTRKGN